MSEPLQLCTLFDSRFLVQGLTLIESVNRYSSVPIDWTVLTLDQISFDFLSANHNGSIRVLSFQSMQDEALNSLLKTRPWKEVCWTSAACLLNYVASNSQSGQIVAYIDADCFFFSDISRMLNVLREGSSIAIHEHRFSLDRLEWLAKSGRFNVGVVAGVVGEEFTKCLQRWRSQVLNRCDVNQSEGRCGDQTYLNEWPSLYPELSIMSGKGVGLAPWNLNNYQISSSNGRILVDQDELYFYHFHGLKIGYFTSRIAFFTPATGYALKRVPNSEIYKPYLSQLQKAHRSLNPEIRSTRLRKSLGWFLRKLVKSQLFVSLNYSNKPFELMDKYQ